MTPRQREADTVMFEFARLTRYRQRVSPIARRRRSTVIVGGAMVPTLFAALHTRSPLQAKLKETGSSFSTGPRLGSGNSEGLWAEVGQGIAPRIPVLTLVRDGDDSGHGSSDFKRVLGAYGGVSCRRPFGSDAVDAYRPTHDVRDGPSNTPFLPWR